MEQSPSKSAFTFNFPRLVSSTCPVLGFLADGGIRLLVAHHYISEFRAFRVIARPSSSKIGKADAFLFWVLCSIIGERSTAQMEKSTFGFDGIVLSPELVIVLESIFFSFGTLLICQSYQ